MMLCPTCSKENYTGAVFCRFCGIRLPAQSVRTEGQHEISIVPAKNRKIKFYWIIGSLLVVAVLVTVAITKKPRIYTGSEIYDKYKNAIVVVGTLDEKGNERPSYGTGIVISNDGLILTNAHVITGGKSGFIKNHNEAIYISEPFYDKSGNYEKGVFIDPYFDIATFKVQSKDIDHIDIHSESFPQIGSKVFCIGNPQLMANTLSEGNVSSLREDGLKTFIQTTAPISQGSSGGSMFDVYGKLIGITSNILEEGQNINFAIPIKYAMGPIYRYLFLESTGSLPSKKDISRYLDTDRLFIDGLRQKTAEMQKLLDDVMSELKNKKKKLNNTEIVKIVKFYSDLLALSTRIKTFDEIENKLAATNGKQSPDTYQNPTMPVMKIAGNYIRTSVTPTCETFFDANIEVLQNDNNLILRGKDTGLDSIGMLATGGKLSVTIAWVDGTSYPCTGVVVNDTASGACNFQNKTCHFTYVKK